MTEAPLLPLDEQTPCEPQSPAEEVGPNNGCNSRDGGQPSTMLALIDRLAFDPRVDPDKLERILTLKERIDSKEAEHQFDEAKARIKKQLIGIKFVKSKGVRYEVEKNKPEFGTYEAFKYVPLEDIDRHLGPLCAAENMDMSYSVEPLSEGRYTGRLRLKCAGHTEDYMLPLPLDTTGGKSNVQAMGSTNSYFRRYLACNAFNIVVIGDDDDGTGGLIDSVQLAHLRQLLNQIEMTVGKEKAVELRLDEVSFCRYLHTKELGELPFHQYRKASSSLLGRLAKLESRNADPA